MGEALSLENPFLELQDLLDEDRKLDLAGNPRISIREYNDSDFEGPDYPYLVIHYENLGIVALTERGIEGVEHETPPVLELASGSTDITAGPTRQERLVLARKRVDELFDILESKGE